MLLLVLICRRLGCTCCEPKTDEKQLWLPILFGTAVCVAVIIIITPRWVAKHYIGRCQIAMYNTCHMHSGNQRSDGVCHTECLRVDCCRNPPLPLGRSLFEILSHGVHPSTYSKNKHYDMVEDVSKLLVSEVSLVGQCAIARTFGQDIPALRQRTRLLASPLVRVFVRATSSCRWRYFLRKRSLQIRRSGNEDGIQCVNTGKVIERSW